MNKRCRTLSKLYKRQAEGMKCALPARRAAAPWPIRALTPCPPVPPLLCVSVSCRMGSWGLGLCVWGRHHHGTCSRGGERGMRPSFEGPPHHQERPRATTFGRRRQARVPYSIDDSDRRPAALHMWAAPELPVSPPAGPPRGRCTGRRPADRQYRAGPRVPRPAATQRVR